MNKKIKEKDLICSNCGMVYPLKIRENIIKIHGFKYVYCFGCKMITRHQTIDSIDLYKCELMSKDKGEYTGKDKVLARYLIK